MEGPIFEAVVTPYRSLGRRGVRYAGIAILVSCAINAVLALALGAWPIAIFAAIELVLALYLFRRGSKAETEEKLVLTEQRLTIQRRDRRGHLTRIDLPTAWLRVALEERGGRASALVLRGRFFPTEVGASLGEEEKRSLAAALAEALYELRHPDFDNPQLREDGAG